MESTPTRNRPPTVLPCKAVDIAARMGAKGDVVIVQVVLGVFLVAVVLQYPVRRKLWLSSTSH